MTGSASLMTIAIFGLFVGITLWISFYMGSRAKSAAGYFAASGGIHWFVNGVAFAGDYLSAASFLGICGMIAFYGYDGFLYSIGYLAGWIVALLVIAEPLKRMGKFTFADALDSRFQSRSIKLTAGVSTLAVSVFYLIPQMVGAGALIKPLLGLPHAVGVITVGIVVITIVVTAGMVSTTYVQFLKGSLLVLFSIILTVAILMRGFTTEPGVDGHVFRTLGPFSDLLLTRPNLAEALSFPNSEIVPRAGTPWDELPYMRVRDNATGIVSVWRVEWPLANEVSAKAREQGMSAYYLNEHYRTFYLTETQTITRTADGRVLVNGLPRGRGEGQAELHPVGTVSRLPGGESRTGPLGPLQFFRTLGESEVILWGSQKVQAGGDEITIFYQKPTPGSRVLQPGNLPMFQGLRGDSIVAKINFISLMLALFCGTASLPHILIRYYTVKDQASARKSTIVGIGSIGFFYILTLFMGLGAMTSGALDVTDSNMSAPLLAKSISELLFAMISAIAFTTVLGTVSGLIIAASGAVVHDFISSVLKVEMPDTAKVRIGKLAAVVVGLVAIVLGILFEKMNVNFLVGWAFSIAASANLPALVMLIFWKGTTRQGIATAIVVGMASSLAWILLSSDTYRDVYGWDPNSAIVPFSQPGIVTIPLGFITLIAVSLLTSKKQD